MYLTTWKLQFGGGGGGGGGGKWVLFVSINTAREVYYAARVDLLLQEHASLSLEHTIA